MPQDDPKQRKPDITKAKTMLNWEPKVKLEDGLNKKRLEREMTFILQEKGLDYLINNEAVNDRAQTLYEENGCDLFPKKKYLFEWVKELQSKGKKIYEKSNKTEQKLMEGMGIATCKFNKNLIFQKRISSKHENKFTCSKEFFNVL